MNRSEHRRRHVFRPLAEPMEGRQLLSRTVPNFTPFQLATNPKAFNPVRPNTPVLPYAFPNRKATFIDPSVHITNGKHIFMGVQTYVGPYATMNATSGFIKIGNASFIGDNARIVSDPDSTQNFPTTSILIGDNVLVSYGARIQGPSVIGGYLNNGKATEIGTNAEVDGAVIGPGAVVGDLARVGPGVTVPGGMMVLPGANVTTDAEASDPSLGKVVPVPSSVAVDMGRQLTISKQLAQGYATLYQGQSATGVTPGIASATASAGPYNGNLANVRGANLEPGAATVSIEPTGPTGPTFIAPRGFQATGLLPDFTARVTGGANFRARARSIQAHLGHGNSIRADEGQPINFGFISQTGNGVTINSPTGGRLTVGRFFKAGDNAVLLGGDSAAYTLGDQVTLGAGAVVVRSSLGTGTTVGDHAYVADSNLPAGTNIPGGSIVIGNKVVGTVQT
jgi:carbonic anhydrase/acetyltransferase-like protein (isoleucine patch superfamily)